MIHWRNMAQKRLLIYTKQTFLNVLKTIRADRHLLQPMINAATGGRPLKIVDILQHELSPILLSLVKHEGEMNTTQKADIINILINGLQTPSDISKVELKTCGHRWSCTYPSSRKTSWVSDIWWLCCCFHPQHFYEITTRVDVIFDHHIGKDSIKAATRSKRVGKKLIRKLIDGPN